MNLAKLLYLCVITVICVITDFRHRKIKNSCVLALLGGWVVWEVCAGTWKGVPDALLGMVVLLGLFLPLYGLRMIGAGDVKLAGAVGLYVGIGGIERFLAALCVSGGCLALGKMMYYGVWKKRFRYLYHYVKRVLLTGCPAEYEMPDKREEVIGMAFPILCGVLWRFV